MKWRWQAVTVLGVLVAGAVAAGIWGPLELATALGAAAANQVLGPARKESK